MNFDKEQILQDISKSHHNLPWLLDNTLFLTVAGSHSRGLAGENSDLDIRGITVPPPEYYHGFVDSFEQSITKEPDSVIFEIRKFFNLASKANANALEFLFTDPKFFIKVTPLGQKLLDHKEQFLSKHIRQTYIQYAKSQAHRIKQHRKFLDNPLDEKPTRASLNLPEKPLIEKNQYDAVSSMIRKKLESWNADFQPFNDSQKLYLQSKVTDILTEMEITKDIKWEAAARSIGLNDNLILFMKKEKEFENHLKDYESYQDWKKNRNPKRAALEAKYKFDLKHGLNLYLIMKMGLEALEKGIFQVERIEDREELLEIKNGNWSYEKLIEEAAKIENKVNQAYETTKLPNQPNIPLINQLCMEIIETSFKKDI